jgi:hypothetical protein
MKVFGEAVVLILDAGVKTSFAVLCYYLVSLTWHAVTISDTPQMILSQRTWARLTSKPRQELISLLTSECMLKRHS